MLDSRVTGELLAEARQAGAKVILAGDDRQLASIERGGLFTELRPAARRGGNHRDHTAAVDWQRQAARDLAEGRFAEAVAAFDQAGAITWTTGPGRGAHGPGRGLEAGHRGGSPAPRGSCSPTPTATWMR